MNIIARETKHLHQNTHAGSVLTQVLNSLSSILEKEKAHLNKGDLTLHEQFARDKLTVLANLDRLRRQDEYSDLLSNKREELEVLSAQMHENLTLLKFRMDAISEISNTISDAMAETESDGTYDVSAGRKAYDQW